MEMHVVLSLSIVPRRGMPAYVSAKPRMRSASVDLQGLPLPILTTRECHFYTISTRKLPCLWRLFGTTQSGFVELAIHNISWKIQLHCTWGLWDGTVPQTMKKKWSLVPREFELEDSSLARRKGSFQILASLLFKQHRCMSGQLSLLNNAPLWKKKYLSSWWIWKIQAGMYSFICSVFLSSCSLNLSLVIGILASWIHVTFQVRDAGTLWKFVSYQFWLTNHLKSLVTIIYYLTVSWVNNLGLSSTS